MRMKEEREAIVEYCIKLIEHRLTKGTGGNISIYDRKDKIMAISPSGLDYYKTKPEDVVVMDLDGNLIEGSRKPSTEYNLHKIFYEQRDDCNSVVHCHSMFSGVLACLHLADPSQPLYDRIGGQGRPVRRVRDLRDSAVGGKRFRSHERQKCSFDGKSRAACRCGRPAQCFQRGGRNRVLRGNVLPGEMRGRAGHSSRCGNGIDHQ